MPGVTFYSSQEADAAAIAAGAFANSPSPLPDTSYVCVGDTIDTDQQEGFLRYVRLLHTCKASRADMGLLVHRRGHGTQVLDGKLMATVCGVVQRTNKLISVVPVKTRCPVCAELTRCFIA